MKKLLLAGMIVATSLFAWGGDNGWHHGDRGNGGWHHSRGGYGFMALIKNLNLTNSQRNKIRDIISKNRYNRMNYRNSSFEIKNGKFDESSYIKTRSSLCENNVKKRAEMIKEIYSILTLSQKKELEKLINERR